MLGSFFGIIIGAIPGLTATMGIALLIPFTFGMTPITGITMLLGIYTGAIYGGGIASILINTPGTPAAAATCFDGYAMAKKGLAGKAIIVFQIIGASFGPICGAMLVDYLLAGGTWPGPRAGFNPAGWVAWLAGFVVGLLPILNIYQVPAAPVAAFLVGAVVYFLCAKAGLLSQVIPLPAKAAAPAGK